MRTCFMVFNSWVWRVVGQSDAGKHLSLDVREVASGTTAQYNWATSWGSYDRTIYGSKALRVSIRNLGRVQGTAHVTVYFYDASYSQVGTADGDLDLKGQIEAVAVVNVPVTVSREVNRASIGANTHEGVRARGRRAG